MSSELPKKRGRRKKVVSENEIPKTTKKNSAKKTDLNDIINLDTFVSKPSNIILYLKCSIKDIEKYAQEQRWKTDNFTYDPRVPCDFVPFENSQNVEMHLIHQNDEAKVQEKPQYVCSSCERRMDKTNESLKEDEIQKIKELKLSYYKNDIPNKKVDCFWCTCPYDNDAYYILQYGSSKDILAHGSFCSPECGVAHLFSNMNWDDSAKMESYQLMNHFYKSNNENIKPASSPYYFLDKYYGNLSIQEYRRLSKSCNSLLCVDKPVTRVLPEIHEDIDKQIHNGTSTQTRGNYKVRKQSEKLNGPSRNTILRDNFRGISVVA